VFVPRQASPQARFFKVCLGQASSLETRLKKSCNIRSDRSVPFANAATHSLLVWHHSTPPSPLTRTLNSRHARSSTYQREDIAKETTEGNEASTHEWRRNTFAFVVQQRAGSLRAQPTSDRSHDGLATEAAQGWAERGRHHQQSRFSLPTRPRLALSHRQRQHARHHAKVSPAAPARRSVHEPRTGRRIEPEPRVCRGHD